MSLDPRHDLAATLDVQRRADLHGRPVVVVTPVLAGATTAVPQALADGASRVLVITWGDGTGPLPDPASAQVHRLPVTAVDVRDEIRAWTALLTTPDDETRRVLDAFDPAGQARVLLHVPIGATHLCGRTTYGARRPEHERLEDKTLSRDIWTAAGVPHAPEEVTPARLDAVRAAASRLDRGAGTVWAADASEGLNGGASLVRHVTDDGAAAFADLAPHARRLRVMPFLDGIPCSIHGMVADDGVAVLRPVELVMLRPGTGRFVQAGISSWWDPQPHDREAMRATARAVGAFLRDAHDYRGSFGIDGILTANGFLPHELNPRHSGGISTLGKGLTGISLVEVHRRLLLDGRLSMPIAELESHLLDACDAHRYGLAYLPVRTARPSTTTVVDVTGAPPLGALTSDDVDGCLQVGRPASGTLEIGPASAGALVRFTPSPLSPGDRLAPWALAAYDLADRLWDTGIGRLNAAPSLR